MQRLTQPRTAQNRIPEQAFKGMLVQFAFHLKKKGRSNATIETQCGGLRTLVNESANLSNPNSVLELVALKECSEGTKRNLINAYKNFARFAQIPLPEMPRYKANSKLPFIPAEAELDMLVACAGDKLQPFLQTLKETFARTIEVANLKWDDVNFQNQTITINDPAKNGIPRQFKVTTNLIAMLERLPKNSEFVFGENAAERMRKNFHWCRKRLAARMHNPRISRIHLHTFRHWGATMLYHHTNNLLLVMEKLGHRSITSTVLYTHIVKTDETEEYVSKAVVTLEEAKALIEKGFSYVTDIKVGLTTYKLFRRKKTWHPT